MLIGEHAKMDFYETLLTQCTCPTATAPIAQVTGSKRTSVNPVTTLRLIFCQLWDSKKWFLVGDIAEDGIFRLKVCREMSII
jgi:hypothetical protein